jgi:hypothetical protein
MEPVDKRKLDREIKPTGAVESQESEPAASVVEEKVEEPKAESDQQGDSEKPKFGRRRRRASSSGVLTPNS